MNVIYLMKMDLGNQKINSIEIMLDYYFYLEKDKEHGVVYDGYKDDSILPFNNFHLWNVSSTSSTSSTLDNSVNYTIEFKDSPGMPIGRKSWFIHDPACGKYHSEERLLSLSVCTLGNEFTCDSGECIEEYRRCDNVFDCSDHSDEKNCNTIAFAGAYDKSEYYSYFYQHNSLTFQVILRRNITKLTHCGSLQKLKALTGLTPSTCKLSSPWLSPSGGGTTGFTLRIYSMLEKVLGC
jgi:hypothetical protein